MTRLAPLSSLALECSKWTNPRTVSGLSPSDIKELAESVKYSKGPSGKPGPMDPPKVQKVIVDGEEITLVISGQRRTLASLEAFSKNHEIDVIDLISPEPLELTKDLADDLTLRALTIENQRSVMSSWELSEAAERLRNGGKTLEVIGEAIGKSESWVSKILKARLGASKELMQEWRRGRITDEQFKELSIIAEEHQAPRLAKVIEARQSNDKSEARTLSKESAIRAKATSTTAPKGGASAKKPARREKDSEVELERRDDSHASGTKNGKSGQTEWKEPPPVAPKAPSKVVIQQMLALAEQRPPTDPYVQGLMHGAEYALDETAIERFKPAWKKYIARIDGSGAKKAPKKSKGKKK